MEKDSWNFAEGEVLLIDKDLHWTSFDVVAKIRNLIRFKKIGHAGTLDPLATGLLIICTGKKTKSIDSIQNADKKYIARIYFGATTPSFDAEFPPENVTDISHLKEQDYLLAFQQFIGTVTQSPPAYSAVKIDGKRAYKLAREGKEVKTKERTIQIFSITPLNRLNDHEWELEIHCSKGTYIRSLASDIGKYLGVGAFLSGLRRTEIGEFSVNHALTIDKFAEMLKSTEEIQQ
jgi:tRNA pseudouridine55 synthase